MYIYGFSSLSSTVHVVAARPRTAGIIAGTILAGFMAWHYHAKAAQLKPVERPVVQKTALIKA